MKSAVVLLALLVSACGPGNTPQPPAAPASSAGNALSTSGGSSSCSARNDAGKDCKITCKAGEAAVCRNGSGTAEPRCTCSP